MMYCVILCEYINNKSCVLCDSQAGMEKDSWIECTSRREHHPLRDYLRWWIRPQAFIFKTLIAMRWIVKRLSPRSRITIWKNKDGWHFGEIKFSNLWADK